METSSSPSSSIPFPKHGIRLSHLLSLLDNPDLLGGRDRVKGLTTTEVCEQIIKPLTSSTQLSFCESLQQQNHIAYAQESTVFISHAWKYQFLDVIDAIIEHFQTNPCTLTRKGERSDGEEGKEGGREREADDTNANEVVIWFDLFSNNQHKAVSLDLTWWSTTFYPAIEQFHHTLIIFTPWHNPIPVTRVWCLYELYCTIQTKSQLDIVITSKEKALFLQQMKQYPTKYTEEMLATIDCRYSDCFIPQDKIRIFAAIEESVGFDELNRLVIKRLQEWNLEVLQIAYNEAEEAIKQKNKHQPVEEGGKDAEALALSYLHAIADLKHFYGYYEEATSVYEECLERRRQLLGEDHVETLITMSNLAQHYDHLSDDSSSDMEKKKKNSREKKEKVIAMHKHCFETFRHIFGETHVQTLSSQLHLTIAMMNDIDDHDRTSREDDERQKSHKKREEEVESMLLDCWNKVKASFDAKEMLFMHCQVSLAAFYAERVKPDNEKESKVYFEKARDYYKSCIDQFANLEGNTNAHDAIDKDRSHLPSNLRKSYPLYLTALYGYASLLLSYHSTPLLTGSATSIILSRLDSFDPVKENESPSFLKESGLKLALSYAQDCHSKRRHMLGETHFMTVVTKELVNKCNNQLKLSSVQKKDTSSFLFDKDSDEEFDRQSIGRGEGNNLRRQLHYQTSARGSSPFRCDDFPGSDVEDEDSASQNNGTTFTANHHGCCVCM